MPLFGATLGAFVPVPAARDGGCAWVCQLRPTSEEFGELFEQDAARLLGVDEIPCRALMQTKSRGAQLGQGAPNAPISTELNRTLDAQKTDSRLHDPVVRDMFVIL